MAADEQGRERARKGASPRSKRAPAGASRARRRWFWRTFLTGIAIGLFWAGWNQAMADLRTIRRLFGF